jgi:hypothetical protein
MKRRPQIIAVITILLFLLPVGSLAQNTKDLTKKATGVRVEQEGIYGPLFVTIDGVEKRIAKEAQQAWILNGGRYVVYSGSDGAGGFENEGQSLHLYDVRTGNHKRILSEYFAIDKVEEVRTSTNKRALLVHMADGGLGASYVAIVDPLRGEVFFRRWARIVARKGDVIVLGFYKEDDWEKLMGDQAATVQPYKTERQNLNALLRRPVIVNKRDN